MGDAKRRRIKGAMAAAKEGDKGVMGDAKQGRGGQWGMSRRGMEDNGGHRGGC